MVLMKFCASALRNSFLLLLLFITASSTSFSQGGTESPYSRYGIGDLQNNGFINQIGMGGISAGFNNPSAINFGNPASYSSIKITTFETSASIEAKKFSNSTESQTNKGASLNYLTVGFPVMRGEWGAAFGIMPYSLTGYDLTSPGSITNPNDTITYQYNERYKGSGGLSRFFIGTGIAPFANDTISFFKSAKYYRLKEGNDTSKISTIVKRLKVFSGLSFGINASYLFGSIDQSRKVEFQNASNIFNTGINDLTYYGDFYLDYGLQYKYLFANNTKFTLGVSGAMAADVDAKRDITWYNFKTTAFGETVKDTVYFQEGVKGASTIPMYWSAGFTLEKGKWMIGADYGMQDWSSYKSFGVKSQSLSNSYHAAIGTGYKPKMRAQYRAGVNYTKTYLDLRNTDINDYSFSLGAGLPIRLTQSERRDEDIKTLLHFAVVGGQKGTTDNNLLKEQYVKFYIGITFNERWFQKRKYD